MATIKPTNRDPISPQSEKFEKNFNRTMIKTGAPAIKESEEMLNEVDGMLSEAEQSLKKKIFSLAKMESLVFSDPKLTTVYEDMAENGEEKYGYHYNETIQNMIFNDYVLNSPQYLQKYKMAIPKEKKRRDKSGINKLKKQGAEKMAQSGLPTTSNEAVNESSSAGAGGAEGAFESPIGFKDDIKNVSKQLDTEAELKDLDTVRVSLPGQEKRAYGKSKPSDANVSSAIANPTPNKAVKKPFYKGGTITAPILNGLQVDKIKAPKKSETEPQGALQENVNGVDTDESTTKVVYLIHPNNPDEVYGYFPEIPHNDRFMTGYAHVGQHSAVAPEYANESRQASPEEYAQLHAELNGIYDNQLEVMNGLQESSTAGSAGGAAGYVGYAGPAAFSKKGDLSKDFAGNAAKKIKKPIYKGGTVIQESEYLTDPSGFEAYIDMLNEEIEISEKAKSKSQQRFMGMVNAYKNGDLGDGDVSADIERAADSMTDTEVDDFASTKHKGLPDHVDEFLNPNDLIGDDVVDIQPRAGETPFELQTGKYQYETATYADGRKDLVVYSFKDDVYYDYKKFRESMGIDENNIKEDNKIMDENHLNSREEKISFLTKALEILKPWETQQMALRPNLLPHLDDEEIDTYYQNAEAMLAEKGIDATTIKEDTQTMIQNNGTSMSNKAQATGDMSSNIDTGAQQTSGLNEAINAMDEIDDKLLEELNKELEAFSVHHDKLKLMAEDRKTTSQILNKRVTDQNPSNFKKDLNTSGVKQTIDVEKELEWKDQQTDVGKDPQKLGADLEKNVIKTADMKSDEALKNVGNSTNNEGDEVPKRNLTTKEQEEVNLYRNGQHSLTYDNEPDERFVERMKADQGEFFEMGEKQKEFKAGAPQYDKDTQPVDDGIDKSQFDKNVKKKGDKVAWNDRMGIGSNVKLAESMISGRFTNEIGKSHIVDFKMSETALVESTDNLFELNFTGLGNKYVAKTVDNKVIVNEAVVNVMESHKFFTNGKEVFAVKNAVQAINEGATVVEKPVINEEQEKMKHLLGYKPENYVSTKSTKQNRKF